MSIYYYSDKKMAENIKNNLRQIVREAVKNIMEMPGDGYIQERPLTPAEEKKKEELVKALKPKYGKTPKTYAIATAQAKELAEDMEEEMEFDRVEPMSVDNFDSKIISPRDGINASNKWLAIVLKNDDVHDNEYFDSEDEAKGWCDKCCESLQQEMDERMLAFPDKTRTPGHNKENLPYHSPVSKTLDEELEEEIEFTDKYDNDSNLKGKQSKLPDHLQKAIINKKDSAEENLEEENEFTDKYDNDPKLKGKQSKLPDHLQKAIIGSKEESLEEDILSFSAINLQPRKRVKHLPYHASERHTKK